MPAGTWRSHTAMPTARFTPAVAEVAGKIYAIGGNDSGGSASTVNEQYDPATDSWSTKTAMPTARDSPTGAVVSGTIYCIGGNIAVTPFFSAANEAYDPATDSWSTKTALGTARDDHAYAVYGGKVYVFGGKGVAGVLSSVVAYDPGANTWATKAPIPVATQRAWAITVGSLIYLVGGDDGTSVFSTTRVYDPVGDSWSTVSSMPTARRNLVVGQLNDRFLYAIGGITTIGTGSATDIVERYDPLANTWSTVLAMPTVRESMGAASIAGTVYVIGGVNGSTYLATNEQLLYTGWTVGRIAIG